MFRKGISEFDSEIDYCNIDKIKKVPNDPPICEKSISGMKSGSHSQLTTATHYKNNQKTIQYAEDNEHIRFDVPDLKKPRVDSRSDIWNRLNKPKVENEKLHQEFKQLKEQKELAACTFKPSITKHDPNGNLLVPLDDK